MSDYDAKEKKNKRLLKEQAAQMRQVKLQDALMPQKLKTIKGKLVKSHALDNLMDERHHSNPRQVGKGKAKLTRQELQFNNKDD